MDFFVSGRRITLDRARVRRRLRTASPGPIRTHAVDVDKRLFPVKQALALATGLDPLDFNTYHARRIFQRLGFRVRRVQ
jgi:hypothetical protein